MSPGNEAFETFVETSEEIIKSLLGISAEERLTSRLGDTLTAVSELKAVLPKGPPEDYFRVIEYLTKVITRISDGEMEIDTITVEVLDESLRDLAASLDEMREASGPVENDFLSVLLDKLDVLYPVDEWETEAEDEGEAPGETVFDWDPGEFEEMIEDFAEECLEILERFGNDLLGLEESPDDRTLMDSIFRAAHTLKGNAGMLGLEPMVRLAHKAENRLDEVRKGLRPLTAELTDHLLKTQDALREIIEAVASRSPITTDVERLIDRLEGGEEAVEGEQAPPVEPDSGEDSSGEAKAPAVSPPAAASTPAAAEPAGGTWVPSEYEDIIDDFVEECREILERFGDEILVLEKEPGNRELLDSIFRVAHTLKGNAGLIGLTNLNTLSHKAEDRLNRVRKGEEEMTPELMDLLLNFRDEAGRIVEEASARESVDLTPSPIEALLAGIEEPSIEAAGTGEEPRSGDAGGPGAGGDAAGTDGELIEAFNEEAGDLLAEYEKTLGILKSDPSDGKAMETLHRVAHTLKGSAGLVGMDSLRSLSASVEKAASRIMAGGGILDPGLLDAFVLSLDAARDLLTSPGDAGDSREELKRLELLLAGRDGEEKDGKGRDRGSPAKGRTAAGPDRPRDSGVGPPKAAEVTSLRVGIEKLDEVMNLVGELVISKIGFDQRLSTTESLINNLLGGLRKTARTRPGSDSGPVIDEIASMENLIGEMSEELVHASDQLGKFMTELQASVMKTRMVPISQVFNRFPRAIRDLARKNGKKIELVIHGAETELDKTVVEKITDPFLHLIRNSVDHGIEPPEERRLAGKNETGVVTLSAAHVGDRVRIEIKDDGKGISPGKIRESALTKGLITEEEARSLDDERLLQLIFRPGFSTAEKVTDISGRGVGMDVVRDSVVALKGDIKVASAPGEGTTIMIEIPLTLAIIQVLLVKASGETFAIPISAIEETIYIDTGEIRPVGVKETINFRGKALPVVRLDSILGLEGSGMVGYSDSHYRQYADLSEKRSLPLIIVDTMDVRLGILVERMIRKQEIVIKTLGDILKGVKFAAGATIMGDGSVVIILDVPKIVTAVGEDDFRTLSEGPKEGEMTDSAGERGFSVLLVEDSKTIRKRMAAILSSAGFRVVEAEDGRDGLEKAQAEEFDCVSTDVVMPRMNGYEFVRSLRSRPEYAETPVVMVTSRTEELDKRMGFEAGVDDYITKPFAENLLVKTLKRLLI